MVGEEGRRAMGTGEVVDAVALREVKADYAGAVALEAKGDHLEHQVDVVAEVAHVDVGGWVARVAAGAGALGHVQLFFERPDAGEVLLELLVVGASEAGLEPGDVADDRAAAVVIGGGAKHLNAFEP